MHDPQHDHAHAHPNVWYFGVFLALLACTALSVIFDVVEFPSRLVVAMVLAVACAKALFVMAYFMHLKFEGRWTLLILAPTTILAIGLMTALAPDMAMHYYTNDTPQGKGLYSDATPAHDDAAGSHAESHDAGSHGH